MELQALLVLCGVGVAGLAMVLLMGLFSASGTSYEEAIAQQRRATTELLALADSKNKPKKKDKKANKKQAKKEKNKDNAVASTGSELESEAPAESGVDDDSVPAAKGHVEFSSSVVVDVPRDTPPNVKIRKRGKDPKVKPILLNKEDPSCVSDPTALADSIETVTNHFEEMHPKDEFELLHSTLVTEKVQEKVEQVADKKESKTKTAKGGKTAAKPAAPIEVVKEEIVRERHNSGDSAKEQRKGKKVDKRSPEEVVEEVVPPLNAPQPSELTTDKLLKQIPAPPAPVPPNNKGKKKKPEPNVLSLMAGDSGGVNVGELVRVVREAALSRNEIQILTDALLNKHHDPLPEYSEWTEEKLKKQLAEKEKALMEEVQAAQRQAESQVEALTGKLKELRAQLAAAAGARAELHALQPRLQRALDDNQRLQQDKLLLQSKLGAEAEAQAQRVQMEMHIQRLSESEAALVAQLAALQGELNAHALEAGQARMEAVAARDSLLLAQQHAAELAQQLQEANRAYGELEQQRQHAVHNEQRAQQELRQVQERLAGLTELQNEVQRLASRAQAADSNADKINNEKLQMANELASLKEQLALRESELAEVKQMKTTPAQNGLPSNNDQAKAAELGKVESLVSALRAELGAAQREARAHRDHVARLADQLAAYQDKNNEAIAKAQEAQYKEVAQILRAACPGAAPHSDAGRSWLTAFADNLRTQLAKAEQAKAEHAVKLDTAKQQSAKHAGTQSAADERLKELEVQNEYSQALVEKYKKIIDDTEGVLSRLQQNVTLEEQRWAQQLAEKQRELDELSLNTVSQMQKKIESLQSELRQAKGSNHNHTFADSERHAEERLMGSFTDKHNVDVCNGPLQMGLEDK